MADVKLSQRAATWLEKADPTVQDQVTSKLREAGNYPTHHLTRLSNSPHYRLRAGDYRAIIDWKQNDEILFVREIGHRSNIYD